MTFGEVVKNLVAAGIERYHTDLVRGEQTYYLPNGESEVVKGDAVAITPARDFSATGVDAAVKAIQGGKIQYRSSASASRRPAASAIWSQSPASGRTYYGRTGDSYVEWFPGAKREQAA